MTVSTFEGLFSGICELAGAPVPDVPATDAGPVAIAIEFDGVKFVLAHEAGERADHVCMLAVFGPLPSGNELAACRALLQLNARVHCLGHAFGRNPATADIVLKHHLALDETTAVELYQQMVSTAEGIRGWRQHHFLVEPEAEISP
jgi:hypothetical protein